jgi:hypothetical protein
MDLPDRLQFCEFHDFLSAEARRDLSSSVRKSPDEGILHVASGALRRFDRGWPTSSFFNTPGAWMNRLPEMVGWDTLRALAIGIASLQPFRNRLG